MSNRRHDIHDVLLARLRDAAAGDTRVRGNADTPNDWDAEEMADVRHVLIVRHGGFTRRVITGKIDWFHAPVIEGHTRAGSDEALGAPSNALLDTVIALLDDDPTLGGICEDVSLEIDEDPELNVEPDAGSMLAWKLKLGVHVEELIES